MNNKTINKKKEIKKLRLKIKFTKELFALSLLGILIIFIGTSLSELLEDGVEVQPKSDLTYYLTVSYDGIDKNGKASDSSIVAEIRSGDLFIEDKLPEGLTFQGFETTSNGTFGAVQRGDKTTLCTGKVVDDTNESSFTDGVWNEDNTEYTYHGLHYNKETNTVTFRVRNLQAGCELVVGIKTKTPTIDNPATEEIETRRDFYNFATIREQDLTIKSNTSHAYMGKMINTLYEVQYVYEGDIPENVPTPPDTMEYIKGATVGVAGNIEVEGYEFEGWTSTDVSISNNKFIMPEETVVLRGKFTKINKNKVTYKINGVIPNNYVVPTEKEYVKNSSVELDILEEGDIINGYRFLGWKTTSVKIDSDNTFIMPESDVVITGEFEEVKYKVIYKFYDTILPPNAEACLPETKEFKPGEEVLLEDIIRTELDPNYVFLGWNSDEKFYMPEEDVIVYGEWKRAVQQISPSIKSEIVSKKDYYRIGDIVNIKITVTNNSTYEITNVLVQENLEGIEIIESTDYDIKSASFANIKVIPAGSKKSVNINYKITKDSLDDIITNSEIIGVSSTNPDLEYELNPSNEYKSSSTIKLQSKLKICETIDGVGPNNIFQVKITGEETGYETWITLDKNTCKEIYINPGTYRIKQIVPQEYTLTKVENAINKNDSTVNIEEKNTYEVNFTNEFKKKGFLHSFGRSTFKILQRRDE